MDEPHTDKTEENIHRLFTQMAGSERDDQDDGAYESYLAFLAYVDKYQDFSHLDNLQVFLKHSLEDFNIIDEAGLFAQFKPEFNKNARMTAVHLPLGLSFPYDLWALTVAEYQDALRDADPDSFQRISAIAAGKPDPASPIHYTEKSEIDNELAVFGNHLIGLLRPYRALRTQLEKFIPELETRPSVRVVENYVHLAAHIRCKTPDAGPDVADLLNDYQKRAAKGRGHLRVVRPHSATESNITPTL